MRVLHLLKTSTGAAWTFDQVAELRRRGVDVHVALPEDLGFADRYRDIGAQVHIAQFDLARLRSPRLLASAMRDLRDLTHAVAADVVHSHFVGTTLLMRMALRFTRTPRIFQVPGPLHLEGWATRQADMISATSQDHWVGTCKATVDLYRRSGAPADRVSLVYYGRDYTTYLQQAPVDLRSELGIGSHTAIIGMVAQIYPPKRILGHTRGIKGHEDLIDAVALLIEQGRDVVAVFAGAASSTEAEPYAESVRRYAHAKLGERARFLGFRTDVAGIYHGFDVAVHPSHSENLGGASESLLAGTPTIATRVGGFPDLIIPGDTGWLTPPADPASLAEVLAEVLDNTEQGRALALEGRRRVLEQFRMDHIGEQILSLYETVARR